MSPPGVHADRGKKDLSIGASFAWRVAALEAPAGRFRNAEVEHVFIGIMSLGKVLSEAGAGPLQVTFQDQQALQNEWNDVSEVLASLKLNPADLRRKTRDRLGTGRYARSGETVVHRSEECRKAFERAEELAVAARHVLALHLLGAIMETPSPAITAILEESGVHPVQLREKTLLAAARSAMPTAALVTSSEMKSVRMFSRKMGISVLTVMFDDIVGSTAMFGNVGEKKWHELRAEHDETVKKVVAAGGCGEIVKSTGDGLLATFTAPSAAVEAAMEIQKVFHGHEHLSLRIGMDMGQVQVSGQDATKDVFGLRVATACRITGMAQGGHVLCSKAVYEEANRWLTAGQVAWQYVGAHCFKPGEPTLEIYEAYNPQFTIPMPRSAK